MIIGIDASKAASKNKTGVENYVYELILNLKKIDHDNTYYLYTNKHLPDELLGKNFIEKKLGLKRLWNSFFLPLDLLFHRCDVYIQPSDLIPWSAPQKSIAVIHDLASFHFPKSYSVKDQVRNIRTFKNYEKRAAHAICVSESTKKDLITFFKEFRRKVDVIPLGFDTAKFHPLKNIDKPEIPYLFYSGRIEQRKNIINIVKAFYLLKKEKNIPHKLILAGSPGYGFEKIIDFIRNNPTYSGDVVMPGFISYEELLKMMSAADAFVSPTLYEGFGLSVLEAMACGAAVLTSDSSSLPEVVGDGALLCDPLDENDIAEKLFKIIDDESFRTDLKQKAMKQAAKFSWEKTAELTLNLINRM